MPLLSHSQSLGLQLQTWDQAMRQDLRWKLILRNFDRECDRGDIDPRKLDDFLRKLEVEWQTLSPAGARGPTNPAAAIDNAISGARKFFLLPGKPLASPVEATKLYRYVRLDKFWKYNLQGFGHIGSIE